MWLMPTFIELCEDVKIIKNPGYDFLAKCRRYDNDIAVKFAIARTLRLKPSLANDADKHVIVRALGDAHSVTPAITLISLDPADVGRWPRAEGHVAPRVVILCHNHDCLLLSVL